MRRNGKNFHDNNVIDGIHDLIFCSFGFKDALVKQMTKAITI